MRNILLLVLVAASLALFDGCASSPNGDAMADAAVYSNGALQDTLAVSMMGAHVATLAGARDLQLTIINDTKSFSHANITARTAANTKFDIILIQPSRNLTQIRIRVGTSGDEQLSRELLAKIKGHL